jgi:cobalt-zinc-cadmium efflux system protein
MRPSTNTTTNIRTPTEAKAVTVHDHHHDHDHSHGHSHGVRADADRRGIAIALALLTALAITEGVVGILTHSLALLSDAGHMVTDVSALALALLAIRLAGRAAGGNLTYGLKRSEILAAQFNGATLFVVGLWWSGKASDA